MNQNNNPFGNLSQDGLEKTGDSLGGGGVFDSDLYTGNIVLAYAGKSDGGANFFEVHVDTGNGRVYRERLWVTNKVGQNFYERDGKKSPLPGFTTANDLALLSTGHELNAQTFEEKVVKLYDFDAKAELPKKVQAATSMMGLPVTIGVLKAIVDKQKKNDAGGYEPTGETREENNIDKVFHAESGKTVSEFSTKAETAEFKDKWLAKNKGQVRNKAKGAEGKSGAPGRPAPTGGAAAAGKSSQSLFGN